MLKKILAVFVFLILLGASAANAELLTVFTRSPEGPMDSREAYNTALIDLALEKTKNKYGTYTIKSIPVMTRQRSQYAASSNLFPNLIIEESYEEKFVVEGNLIYANFPVELGIVGMRVCFVNPKLSTELSQITSLEQLKKYKFLQGTGWTDVYILRQKGFSVVEMVSYESLFKMIAAGRADLLCRGANELLNESREFKSIHNLIYNKTFAIFYPLPRFYFTHKANQLLKVRLEEGLKLAYQDGSLKKLWEKEFGASVEFSDLQSRKIFRTDNPLVKNISKDYELYFYNPDRSNKAIKNPE